MISKKEIAANIKTDELDILFRMDSNTFDEDMIETIEALGCQYLIKAKVYPTLASQVTDASDLFIQGDEGGETIEFFKFVSLSVAEYRQQIKTFRLKHVFLAAKIIKTARYVIMKLSENIRIRRRMNKAWSEKFRMQKEALSKNQDACLCTLK